MENAVSFVHSPSAAFQASPKLMPPRQRGETRTAAVGLRMRWRLRRDAGVAGLMKDMLVVKESKDDGR